MTESSAETQGNRSAGVYLSSLLVCLLCTAAWSGQAARADFEVGQQWVYRHEGPRPGNIEPNVIDGERIVQVISTADGPEGKQWVLEERFTNSKDVISRFHVNQEQILTLLEMENKKGEVAKLRYDPLTPYRATDLAVGQKRAIETTLKIESVEFSLPSTITIERLENETIATPAGEFVGCYHYRTTTLATVNIKIAKIPITEERQQWYHPRAGGMVKEVYRRGPIKFLTWSRQGYTATSELQAFGKQEVKPPVKPVLQDDTNDPPARQPLAPPAKRSFDRTMVLILILVAGVLVIGHLRSRKRARR